MLPESTLPPQAPKFIRQEEVSVSLGQLIGCILQQRRLVVRVILMVLALTLLHALVAARTFTATSTFIPEMRKSAGGLSGIAAQLGVAVPSSEPTDSPQFYADLVRSREILRLAAQGKYAFGRDSQPLVSGLGIGSAESPASVDATIKWLDARVTAAPAAKTGVISLTVKAPTAALAQQINSRLLDLLNDFNLKTRQSQASAERKFAEERVVEVRDELRSAEDALQAFLQRNQGNLRAAPDLQFQQDRLAREVQLRQQVYTSLVQSYEQARLEEVRDTPVITVLDPPEMPLGPDSKRLATTAVLSFIFGLVLAIGIAVTRAALNGSLWKTDPTPDELAALASGALSDVRKPWNLVVSSRRPARLR